MPEQSQARNGDIPLNGNEAVERICEEFRRQDVDPLVARSLTFVTWEELIRTVVTAAGEADVFAITWPSSEEQ